MNLPFYSRQATRIEWTSCTGANKQNILLLLTRKEIPAQVPFAKKILRAVNIDFDEDIHFCTHDDVTPISILSDPHVLTHDTVIVFGIRPSQLGIYDRDHLACQICSFENITCLLAPSLQDVAADPELKKKLWDALQEIFRT